MILTVFPVSLGHIIRHDMASAASGLKSNFHKIIPLKAEHSSFIGVLLTAAYGVNSSQQHKHCIPLCVIFHGTMLMKMKALKTHPILTNILKTDSGSCAVPKLDNYASMLVSIGDLFQEPYRAWKRTF